MTPAEFAAFRHALGLSQAELALAMGITAKYGRDHVSAWERGRYPVPGPVAMALRHMAECQPGAKRDISGAKRDLL